jgi:hypothetical protein
MIAMRDRTRIEEQIGRYMVLLTRTTDPRVREAVRDTIAKLRGEIGKLDVASDEKEGTAREEIGPAAKPPAPL